VGETQTTQSNNLTCSTKRDTVVDAMAAALEIIETRFPHGASHITIGKVFSYGTDLEAESEWFEVTVNGEVP